ncbi:MAG: MaoC family dehydratase N-terminal domain-containing protein [Chloroflexi bacterium]|nr:MaoC family dehydratase N-terminal domain-containing protein [Chloroflexota bacterium]
MTTHDQSYEEALAEYIERSKELLDLESLENLPPRSPSPYEQSGPPYEAAFHLDSRTAALYAYSIGDDNPLYTDPEYAKTTRYGCQIAPGPVFVMVRHPSVHGASRPQGYPVANFFSGAAWEFYDAVRVGSRFRSSKVSKEFIERRGAQGTLLFLISDDYFWDFHGDLLSKCYGIQIMVPQPAMGGGRVMPVERLGERMMYNRKASQFTPEQVQQYVGMMEGRRRRGAEPRYWEDVQVGEKIGPMVLPPWTLQDQECLHYLTYCSWGGAEEDSDALAFEPSFRRLRRRPGGARTNPLTMWPWTPGAEHEDAVLASYRGQPGPFDFGIQRVQIPQQLLTNWMGDDGFIRRMFFALRRPVYYGDVTVYTGEVVKKYKVVQEGDDQPGGVPGKREYYAVGIVVEGANQVGEVHAPGTATVYLPSREGGPVQLPVPHPAKPPFVNYDTFRRDWY